MSTKLAVLFKAFARMMHSREGQRRGDVSSQRLHRMASLVGREGYDSIAVLVRSSPDWLSHGLTQACAGR